MYVARMDILIRQTVENLDERELSSMKSDKLKLSVDGLIAIASSFVEVSASMDITSRTDVSPSQTIEKYASQFTNRSRND